MLGLRGVQGRSLADNQYLRFYFRQIIVHTLRELLSQRTGQQREVVKHSSWRPAFTVKIQSRLAAPLIERFILLQHSIELSAEAL
ncbi:MAG: hypothetical protein C4289_01270 [Chloroflexota bacterium]